MPPDARARVGGGDVALKGDFAALQRFAGQVADLGELPRLVALGAVARLEELAVAQFGESADPYGVAWDPLKAGGAPLAALAGDVEVTAFGEGRIRAEALYPANFHHTGMRNVSRKRASKRITAAVKGGFIDKPSSARRREMAERISSSSGMHAPARPIVPTDARGLPARWEAVLEETAERIFKGTVREAA